MSYLRGTNFHIVTWLTAVNMFLFYNLCSSDPKEIMKYSSRLKKKTMVWWSDCTTCHMMTLKPFVKMSVASSPPLVLEVGATRMWQEGDKERNQGCTSWEMRWVVLQVTSLPAYSCPLLPFVCSLPGDSKIGCLLGSVWQVSLTKMSPSYQSQKLDTVDLQFTQSEISQTYLQCQLSEDNTVHTIVISLVCDMFSEECHSMTRKRLRNWTLASRVRLLSSFYKDLEEICQSNYIKYKTPQ